MSRINQKEAKVLCQNFIDTKLPELDRITGKEDVNAIWFDIEELEKFIAYAKSEANNQEQKINGIRIYLGSYDSKFEIKEKAGMTTVFLSATINGPESLENSRDLNAEVLNFGGHGYPPKRVY